MKQATNIKTSLAKSSEGSVPPFGLKVQFQIKYVLPEPLKYELHFGLYFDMQRVCTFIVYGCVCHGFTIHITDLCG